MGVLSALPPPRVVARTERIMVCVLKSGMSSGPLTKAGSERPNLSESPLAEPGTEGCFPGQDSSAHLAGVSFPGAAAEILQFTTILIIHCLTRHHAGPCPILSENGAPILPLLPIYFCSASGGTEAQKGARHWSVTSWLPGAVTLPRFTHPKNAEKSASLIGE